MRTEHGDRAVSLQEIRDFIEAVSTLNHALAGGLSDLFCRIECFGVDRSGGTVSQNQHQYLSTYCLHGACSDCRLSCKICQSLCVCGCHKK